MIDEIDNNKYIVIKTTDLNYLNSDEQKYFADSLRKMDILRMEKENKPINRYLVLNMLDFINLQYLDNYMHEKFSKLCKDELYYSVRIDKIAVHIVNAILKANR